eukprot:5324050-Prymnesium_polylepis.1
MPDWFFHNQMYAIMQTSAEALKGDQEISARTWDDDRYARRCAACPAPNGNACAVLAGELSALA